MSSKTIYTSPACSCIICHKELSVKGIHSHYQMAHTEEGHARAIASGNKTPIRTGKTAQTVSQEEKYNESPKCCLQCGSIIPYNKRENKFCSSPCAATYNNLRKDYTKFKPGPKKGWHITRNMTGCKAPPVSEIKRLANDGMACRVFYCDACGAIHCSFKNKVGCKCGFGNSKQLFPGLSTYFGLSLANIGTQQFISDISACRDRAQKMYDENGLLGLTSIIGHPDKTGGGLNKILVRLGIKFKKPKKMLPFSEYSPRHISGWIEVNGKQHFYRSSYELLMIGCLSDSSVDFDVEGLRVPYHDSVLNKERVAIPDFVLIDKKIILEIKSAYTHDEQNIIDRFVEYSKLGYRPILVLDDHWYDFVDGCLVLIDQPDFITKKYDPHKK